MARKLPLPPAVWCRFKERIYPQFVAVALEVITMNHSVHLSRRGVVAVVLLAALVLCMALLAPAAGAQTSCSRKP